MVNGGSYGGGLMRESAKFNRRVELLQMYIDSLKVGDDVSESPTAVRAIRALAWGELIDTSVASEGDAVADLGAMNLREIGILMSCSYQNVQHIEIAAYRKICAGIDFDPRYVSSEEILDWVKCIYEERS